MSRGIRPLGLDFEFIAWRVILPPERILPMEQDCDYVSVLAGDEREGEWERS
jgi:hypothetical protein